MSTPERILQINAGSGDFGGVSSILFNIFEKIDKSQYIFDFLSPVKTTYKIKEKEIRKMGGRIYELGVSGNRLFRRIKIEKAYKNFLDEHCYDIVHINSGSISFNAQIARLSKKVGIKTVIVHSHNCKDPGNHLAAFFAPIFRAVVDRHADIKLACSKEAATYMFGHEASHVTIIKNGIDISRFSYSDNARLKKRKELKIGDSILIGNVGRFTHQKNHRFMIEILHRLANSNLDIKMLLIGSGPLKSEIMSQALEYKLDKKIIFLDNRSDVNELMSAMDIFIMPSLYEGLPVSGIEAQSSGLVCLFSNYISKEVLVLKSAQTLPINDGVEKWCDIIKSNMMPVMDDHRAAANRVVAHAGYDIDDVVNVLSGIYKGVK